VNEALISGSLSLSQRTRYITLLCKDGATVDSLNSCRPISLLNVDYKITSKVITNRISRVAGDVINEDQTCGIPMRTIADNLHLTRNVIDYATLKNLSCALVSCRSINLSFRPSGTRLFIQNIRSIWLRSFAPSF